MTNTFRVVIPTADGYEVAGEFPTRLYASMLQNVLLTERCLSTACEKYVNGRLYNTEEIAAIADNWV